MVKLSNNIEKVVNFACRPKSGSQGCSGTSRLCYVMLVSQHDVVPKIWHFCQGVNNRLQRSVEVQRSLE